jgi:transposase
VSRKERRARERKSRKKRGGQHGHEGSQLKMTATPDHKKVHKAVVCNHCHARLDDVKIKGYKKRQVFDIHRMPIQVTVHLAEQKECPYCRKVTTASFPVGVTRPAQYGSRLKISGVHIFHMTVRMCFTMLIYCGN